MKAKLSLLLLATFISFTGYSQDCSAVIGSVYFSYPNNSNDSTITTRSRDQLVEKELRTGDSTVWKINWTSKCTYTAQYISGSKKLDLGARDFLEKNKFAFEVEAVTPEYFIVASYIDKVKGRPFSRDTGFFQRKSYAVNKLLFEQVKSLAELKKKKFSDTSQYAVVCIYRKGKFPCSAVDGEIFFGGNLMAILPNRTAGIFKVNKEGSFEIESLGKERSLTKSINIEFGKKYYISFDPVLGRGCRFEIMIEDEKLAKEEFEALL